MESMRQYKVLVFRFRMEGSSIARALFSLVDAVWEKVHIPEGCRVFVWQKECKAATSLDYLTFYNVAITQRILKFLEVWQNTPAWWGVMCDGDVIPTRPDSLVQLVNFLDTLSPNVMVCCRRNIWFNGVTTAAWRFAFTPQYRRLLISPYSLHVPHGLLAFRATFLPTLATIYPFVRSRLHPLARLFEEALTDSIYNMLEQDVPGIATFPPHLLSVFATTSVDKLIASKNLPYFIHPAGYSFVPEMFSFISHLWSHFGAEGGGS